MLTDLDLIEVEKEFVKWLNNNEAAANSLRRTTHFHSTWGPKAREMTKDELLGYLIEIEKSPKIAIDPSDLDCKRPKIDVRNFIKGNND